MTSPTPSADLLVLPHLPAFCRRNPQVQVELTIQPALTDLVAEGYDGGIRLGESLAPAMVALVSPARWR